ncbi:MAG: hypothetical protein EOP50_06695, partial [Sphingobacteriales bacterium]
MDLFTRVYILPRLNGKTFTGVFMHAPADILEKALGIALIAHAGQKDKAGAPYIMHPLRLMMTATGLDAQVTALLHDVLEDSDFTEDDLYAAGIPPHICAAVATLTGAFLLRSGQTSSTYFDKYRFESNPELLKRVAKKMVPLLPHRADVLAGLELGGVPIATAISLDTGMPAAFVRKKAKNYGTCLAVEGADVAIVYL